MKTDRPPTASKFLNYAEASQLLGVKIGTLYAWVSRRTIPFVRLSRRVVRFRRDVLDDWLEDQAVDATTSAAPAAKRNNDPVAR